VFLSGIELTLGSDFWAGSDSDFSIELNVDGYFKCKTNKLDE